MLPKTAYEQVDPRFLVYLAYRLQDRLVRELSTKPRDFVQAKLFFGSWKGHGIGLESPSGGFGIWVVFADGVSSDEVDERTDAHPGTTKDDDDIWFNSLGGMVNEGQWK